MRISLAFRHCKQIVSTSRGTLGARLRGAVSLPSMTKFKVSSTVVPRKGGLPVSNS
jgi:hypothetical protein